MSTLLDAAIVLGAGPPVICVRHRVCHTLCHSVCHSVPPCATVCQPPGASTIIWQTRANIQTPPSVNPVVTNPLLLGTSPIFEKNYLFFSSYSQICFACPCFKNFPGANYLHPIHFKPWHEFLKTRFKTSRILSLYSQELQVKIKHKCQWTNNQQMSQLRYHCMPPRRSIRCTNT